jgi:hypothetical protein
MPARMPVRNPTRRSSHAAGLALALALASTAAYAEDDDDDDAKIPAAEVEKIEAVLSDLGCKGYEEIEKEDNGIYEIDDAKCKMGTVDIKLDKDYTVLVISRH